MGHPGKKSGQDRNKNTAKFLDLKRDTHARLKSLKNLLDLFVESEEKEFFETYSSELFFVFYEEFTNAELNAKYKGAKLKDELEDLLTLLEKIFINLPDKIHSKWHFNTIGLILRKLLHHGNIQPIREQALSLFILWLQILQENVDDINLAIFGSIIAFFPSPITELMKNKILSHSQKEIEYSISCVNGQGYTSTTFTSYLENEKEWCLSETCHAVCPPQQGEKVPAPEDLTKRFLDKVLDCMPRRMLDLQWSNPNMRESGFYHLFMYFKRFYLKNIFPLWDPQVSRLYNDSADLLPIPLTTDCQNIEFYQRNGNAGTILLLCQRAVLVWLIVFTSRLKQKNVEVISSHQSADSQHNSFAGVDVTQPSKNYGMLCLGADIVRTVLFSTQENVTVVHEIFRQGLLMPLNCADTMNHILSVYKDWFFKFPERPAFMLEPKKEKLSDLLSPEELLSIDDCSTMLRSPSYREAVQSCEQLFFPNIPLQNVCAGLQSTCRLFIAMTSQVFFLQQKTEFILKHVDVCKRILKIFRNMVLEMHLDAQTWRQLLEALLKITDSVLEKKIPHPKSSTLGGQLAGYLLQTLFVTWIRASLEVYLTKELWDELLRVLTSLTNWEELIKEWASTMDTLTRVMTKTVYGIDLQDQPLEKLTHRSKVKRFGNDKPSQILNDQSPMVNKTWNSALSSMSTDFSQVKPNVSKSILRCASEPGDLHTFESNILATDSTSPKKLVKQQNIESDFRPSFSDLHIDPQSSFDSISSNNVLTNSMNSDSDCKSEHKEHQLDIDLELEKANELQISYTRLKGHTDSELSLLNIHMTESLVSISSYLNDSSQNLVSLEFGLDDEEKLNPGTSNNDLDFFQSSQLFLSTENSTTSPRASLSLENNLINFEIDAVKESSKHSADAESVGSRKFSLIDNDNLSELKSPTSFTQSEISEEQFESAINVTVSHVRFAAVDSSTINVSEDSFEEDDNEENSVVNGGDVKGWTKVSSMILWQRILCIMGNINEIKDAEIHAIVFKELIQIWSMLETVKRNQGISIDNKKTPPPPKLTPPLFFCSTWCFQAACSGNTTHKSGVVLAYKLACKMIVKSHGLKPSVDQLLYFFQTIHTGLTSFDQDFINAIVGECATIFSLPIDGISCLIPDFITACSSVLYTQSMNFPHNEAITILGSLICFSSMFPEMKIYQPGVTSELKILVLGKEIREMILAPMIKAAKCDPSCKTRCVALCCLGVLVIDSLIHLGGHTLVHDCIALLVSILVFHNHVVSMVALDVLFSLTFYYKEMNMFDATLPLKIVMGVSQVIHYYLEAPSLEVSKCSPEFISKLVLCLLEWLMVIPQEDVLKYHLHVDGALSYFDLAMKAFSECCKKREHESHYAERKPININQIFRGENHPIQIECVHNDFQDFSNETDPSFVSVEIDERKNRMVKLTAEYAIAQVLNFYHLFPLYTGAVRPSSLIVETDDHVIDENQLLEATNVQYLLINGTILLTLIELPQVEYFKRNTNLEGLKTISRFILRDSTGKYCWDVTDIFKFVEPDIHSIQDFNVNKKHSNDRRHSRNLSISGMRLPSSSSSLLPTWETVDINTDRVDQLLRYIGHSSPECLLYSDQPLNMPAPVPVPLNVSIQPLIVTSVLKQHNEEENYVHEVAHDHRINASEIVPPTFHEPTSEYHLSKVLLHQLGYFTSDKRKSIELLERNEKLLRDIKNLDNRPSRETHKIAVFYVGPGQEDKTSILLNSQGSVKFEEFLRGMSWEISLADHTGFMGGLEKNLSTGVTAPYFATHSLEIIFHVSTRIPGGDEDSMKTKLRHLGNDEIHIIWCEHNRDFRRGIINTEFGDVLIIIYPLKNGLYRIQIDCKEKIPPFGPLFDGAIIDEKLLPLLVRSTAISAGRAKRTTIPLYNQHYEERARCIRDISKNRVHPASFEEFCSNIYSPGIIFEEQEIQDGFSRALSLPARKTSLNDSVLKILDLTELSFRDRVGSTLKNKDLNKFPKSVSNMSLNLTEPDDSYKERRKSIPKKFKNKLKTSFATELSGVVEKTL